MNGVRSLVLLLAIVALTNARTIYKNGAVAEWARRRPVIDIIPTERISNSAQIQPRHRRSLEKKGTVTGTAEVPLGELEKILRASVDVQKNLYDGPYGTIDVYAEATKTSHQNPKVHFGICGVKP